MVRESVTTIQYNTSALYTYTHKHSTIHSNTMWSTTGKQQGSCRVMGQSITSCCMLLRGLSQRDPPMETPRQQAGRKQLEGSDLETRGDNW